MFLKIADTIASTISNKAYEPTAHDVIAFGISLFLTSGFITIIIFTIAISTGVIFPTITYCVCFWGLRRILGGFHCRKYYTCVLVSIGLYLPVVLINNIISTDPFGSFPVRRVALPLIFSFFILLVGLVVAWRLIHCHLQLKLSLCFHAVLLVALFIWEPVSTLVTATYACCIVVTTNQWSELKKKGRL